MNMIKVESLHVLTQLGLLMGLLLFPRENNTLCPTEAASQGPASKRHASEVTDPRKVGDK